MKLYFIFICMIGFLFSCEKESEGDRIPVIEFGSIVNNLNIINDTTAEDVITLTFTFTDGDGDLGDGDLFSKQKIRIFNGVETYLNSFDPNDSIDFIPFSDIFTSSNTSVEGTIIHTFKQKVSGFNMGDSAVYEIQVIDRAGNKSNIVRSSPAIILQGNNP